jgi:hypothetical protein
MREKIIEWLLTAMVIVAVGAVGVFGAMLPYYGWKNYRACNPYGNISLVEWYIGIRPADDPCS